MGRTANFVTDCNRSFEVSVRYSLWVAAWSWTSGDGPKAIFTDAVRWLRERDVLLLGVTTLARPITNLREESNGCGRVAADGGPADTWHYSLGPVVGSALGAGGQDEKKWGLRSPGSEPAHRGAGARLLALDSAVGRRCQPGVASDPLDEREKQEAVVAFRHGLEEQCQRWLPEGC